MTRDDFIYKTIECLNGKGRVYIKPQWSMWGVPKTIQYNTGLSIMTNGLAQERGLNHYEITEKGMLYLEDSSRYTLQLERLPATIHLKKPNALKKIWIWFDKNIAKWLDNQLLFAVIIAIITVLLDDALKLIEKLFEHC